MKLAPGHIEQDLVQIAIFEDHLKAVRALVNAREFGYGKDITWFVLSVEFSVLSPAMVQARKDHGVDASFRINADLRIRAARSRFDVSRHKHFSESDPSRLNQLFRNKVIVGADLTAAVKEVQAERERDSSLLISTSRERLYLPNNASDGDTNSLTTDTTNHGTKGSSGRHPPNPATEEPDPTVKVSFGLRCLNIGY